MAKKARFEDLMAELEGVVEELESGNLSLDVSLEKYQKGIELLKSCYKTLDEMEKKIEILEKDSSSSVPFEPGDPADRG
jgi:exodeoxyribonuclease VII small subunit